MSELRLQDYGLAFIYQSTDLHLVYQNWSEGLGRQFVGLIETHFETMAKFTGGRTNLLEPLFAFSGLLLLNLVLEKFSSPSNFVLVLLGFFVILALETYWSLWRPHHAFRQGMMVREYRREIRPIFLLIVKSGGIYGPGSLVLQRDSDEFLAKRLCVQL